MPDAKAIIRITAAPDSALRRALTSAASAGQKASREVAANDIKAAKDAEREKIRATRAAERAAAKAASSAIKAAKDAERAQLRSAKEMERAVRQSASASAKATQRQAKEAERALRQTAVASARAAQKQAAEAKRLAAEQQRATERAEVAKRRAFEATTRAAERGAGRVRREATKTARAQIREAEKAAKAEQRAAAERSMGRRRMLVGAGGAAVGLGAAAVGRARAFGGAFGVRSTEDMAAAAVDMKRRLAILADMGGLDKAQREALQGQILATSARTGVDAGELLAGLETAQDRFSDLKGFSAIIDQLADVSIAGATSIESVVGAMGVMRRQFNLTDEEMQQLSGAMVQAADLGSISFDEFANNFASALGSLGRNANLQGMGGAIKALAITQTLGKSDVAAPEAATLATNLMTSFTREKVRKQVALSKGAGGFGVKLAEGGAMRDLPKIIGELAAAGFMAPENSGRRQKAFPDVQARQALEVLVTEFQKRPEEVAQLLSISPEQGAAAVQRRVAGATEGTLGQASTMGARQFSTFMQSGQFDRFLDTAVRSADALGQLEAKYPLMTEAVGVATGALWGFAGALAADRFIGGAGGKLAGKAAGALGAGGAGVAGLGAKLAGPAAAAGIGTVAAGTLAAGAAGYGITTGLLKLLGGDKTLEQWGAGFAGETPRTGMRGVAPSRIVDQYNATAAIALQSRGGEPQTVDLSPEAIKALAGNAPEATLKIQVQGPGTVTSVRSRDFGFIDLSGADTGRAGMTP